MQHHCFIFSFNFETFLGNFSQKTAFLAQKLRFLLVARVLPY